MRWNICFLSLLLLFVSCGKEKIVNDYVVKNEFNKIRTFCQNKNFNINEIDENGNSYLNNAIEYNRPQIAMLLIDHGIDVNIPNKQGYTSLGYALLNHQDVVFFYILAHGADLDSNEKEMRSPVFIAISENNIDALKVLLDHKFNVNLYFNFGDNSKVNAIQYCCLVQNDVGMLKLLVGHGVDVNSSDSRGNTVLHYAVMSLKGDAWESVLFLLKNGAKGSLKNKMGLTPLEFAQKRKPSKKKTIELLRPQSPFGAIN